MDPVTLLIVLNVIAFVAPYIWDFGYRNISSHEAFMMLGWKNNSDIRDGEYYRLLSSNFLHADIFHLFFNMYALWQLGPATLSIFRNGGFAAIYLLSGISGSLASYYFNPNPSVGASGAIFGLMGALLAYGIVNQEFGIISQLLPIIFINFVYSFLNTQIDNFGHGGGFIAGFVLGLILSII